MIAALSAPDGSRRGFAKVTKDLTDRKRDEQRYRGVLERERERRNVCRELDRMRTAVFEFVAHDLRAPLGVIQNLTYLLQTGWDELPDEHQARSPGSHRDPHDHDGRVGRRPVPSRADRRCGRVALERREFDLNEVIERAVGDALPQGSRTGRGYGSPVGCTPSGMHGAPGRCCSIC